LNLVPKFVPYGLESLLLSLLDDRVDRVRFQCALNVAVWLPTSVNDKVIATLIESVTSEVNWIASNDDFYDYGFAGRHSAVKAHFALTDDQAKDIYHTLERES
jgi:hypothetical protein